MGELQIIFKETEDEDIVVRIDKWRVYGFGKTFREALSELGLQLDDLIRIYSEPGIPIAKGSIEYVKEFLDTFQFEKEGEK